MIRCFVLCHPQSIDLLHRSAYLTPHASVKRIACGTTHVEDADFSEAGDFHPTYASWNSALFETSVILTIWEHAADLIGNNDVAILHSDVKPHFGAEETWGQVADWLKEDQRRPIGLTAPSSNIGLWDSWLIPNNVPFTPQYDPMKFHSFDCGIHVWDYIKAYDLDIYDWAMAEQPRLIYSHQFACSRPIFDQLGLKLHNVASKLKLRDVGLWTPHMFERLIALYLAKLGSKPLLSTAFWHYSSSGARGPGGLSLYGPRPLKYYQIMTRAGKLAMECTPALTLKNSPQ